MDFYFFFFNHNYKKNWHQPFGGASLRVNSSPLFSVKSLTCLCTVAPLMKKCHVSIAFIRLYAASRGMCAGLHYKRRTQSLQGEEKQIQRTPLKSSCNLFLILTNMFNMFGCEADAVPLCRLPVSSKKELSRMVTRILFMFWTVNHSEPGVVERISCRRETKEWLSWSGGAALCDWANLHIEHTWPIGYTVLSCLKRDWAPISAQAHTQAHMHV